MSQICGDHFSDMVCEACESTFNDMIVTEDCFMAAVFEIHHVCSAGHDHGDEHEYHGSFEEFEMFDEGCMWVNHVNDHPGMMTCDCVHHEDPCLMDGECMPEPMCDPHTQPEMVAATLDAVNHTYSLVALAGIFAILYLAYKCFVDRGDKY